MKITLKYVSCNALCFWFSQKVTKMCKSNNILKTVYLWKVLDLRIIEVMMVWGENFCLNQNVRSQYMKEDYTKLYYKITIKTMQ